MPKILIVGASGYLGQFLVEHFGKKSGWSIAFTHHASAPPPFSVPATAYRVNIATGEGLNECFSTSYDVVVNCAAISQPAVCEKDPAAAVAINVPTKLIDAVKSQSLNDNKQPLFVHMSTDQVYSGTKAYWSEADDAEPVNEYGRSKLAGEAAIAAALPSNHVILRSSLIYGPLPPAAPVGRSLFLQFVESALGGSAAIPPQPTTFFSDEYRNAVYVNDIIKVIDTFASMESSKACGIYNMGGPERLSRVDMAMAVAKARGYDAGLIVAAPAAAAGNRGVASPPDISMKSSKLEAVVGFAMTPMSQALQEIFEA